MKTSETKKTRIGAFIRKNDLFPYFTELFSISFFINLLALATPIFVLQVYDRVIFHAGTTTLQGLVLGMIIVLIFDAVLKITRIRFFQSISAKNDFSIAEKIYDKLYRLSLQKLESKPFWYWQSLFRDAGMIRNVLGGTVATLLVDLPFSLLFLLVTILIAPPLWWVFITFLILFVVLALVSEKMIHSHALKERQVSSERDTHLSDLINKRESIKILSSENYLKKQWAENHFQTMKASLSRGKSADFYRVMSQSMTLLFTICITSMGALAILEQQMTIGALIAANMLGSRLISPYVQLVEHWRTLTQFQQALNRVDQFLDENEDKNNIAVDVPIGPGKFFLNNIIFSYNEHESPAINNIDGGIGPNGLHILMGRNGCGKTTLLKLLSGFYKPLKGVVSLDEYDMRQFTSEQLHHRIGYLSQQPQLIQGSVFENITLGTVNADQDSVIEVSKLIDLHDSISELANGYDTVIQSDHHGLSGGFIQKIALARTLLAKPKILLLDEPSNNLDQTSENKLLTTLKEYAKNNTVIVASHSSALLNNADTILVLEQGKVAIAGPAKQVLEHLKKQ